MDELPKEHEPVFRLFEKDGAPSLPGNPWIIVLGTIGWFALIVGLIMFGARVEPDTPAHALIAIAVVTLTGWAVACAHSWEIRQRAGDSESPHTQTGGQPPAVSR